MATITVGEALEGSPVTCRARILGANGTAIVQADIDTIEYEVWRVAPPAVRGLSSSQWLPTETPTEVTSTPVEVDPVDVIFDTLQEWSVDATGFNFKLTIPASDLPVIALANAPKGQYARIDVLLTPTVGEPFRVAFEVGLKFTYYGKVPS